MYMYLIAAVMLLVPQSIFAYNPILTTTTVPYEPMVIDGRVEEKAEYLGHLVGDPQMYEFTVGAETTLSLKVLQKAADSPLLLSLITVKENTRNAGVSEVGRLTAKAAVLSLREDDVLNMSFLESQFFTATLTAGTYRVEVSTPDNYGKYLLEIGTKPTDAGYFATLSHIRTVQKFFDESFFAMFGSSYVTYPLGILILLGLLYFTWRKRAAIQSLRHG
jgi:hypothetical protein